MPESGWVSVLANVLSAQADIEALETVVEDRLSDLREIGQSGPEATLLAELELYIHEFREQLRPEYQVYMVAQSVWDRLSISRQSPVEERKPSSVTERQDVAAKKELTRKTGGDSVTEESPTLQLAAA